MIGVDVLGDAEQSRVSRHFSSPCVGTACLGDPMLADRKTTLRSEAAF